MWLLKDCTETLALFLTTLLSISLSTGAFLDSWKHATAFPHLKQFGLDQSGPASQLIRPVSNLPFLSKVLERIVNKQLVSHSTTNDLLPRNQSDYQKGHLMAKAILKLYDDIVNVPQPMVEWPCNVSWTCCHV